MKDLHSSQNEGIPAQIDESEHHDLNNLIQKEYPWCNFFVSVKKLKFETGFQKFKKLWGI